MGEPIRAGGHVLCDSGWEPVDSPAGRAAVAHTTAGTLTETEQEADMQAAEARSELAPDEMEPGPAAAPEVAPVVLLEPDSDQVDLEPAQTVDFGTSDRAACPDCGKELAVRKDGSLRKHQCVEGDEQWQT